MSIFGLTFRQGGQVYYFSDGGVNAKVGEAVIVETEQGVGMARVRDVHDAPPPGIELGELKPLLRVADADDHRQESENRKLARRALLYCRERATEQELDMRVVDVEVQHDRTKMIFYFTSENRVDFRELVKDLVKEYRLRVELRQIGVRHEVQMLGALGNCGQVCCCARHLRKFAPVTIKMAKEQNLFLNPTKISGICGRLLCCLNYEQSQYEEFYKRCPKLGKKISSGLGNVKMLRGNVFNETITLALEHGGDREISLEEWDRIKDQTPPEPVAHHEPAELRPPRPPKPRPEQQHRAKRPPRRPLEEALADFPPEQAQNSCAPVNLDEPGSAALAFAEELDAPVTAEKAPGEQRPREAREPRAPRDNKDRREHRGNRERKPKEARPPQEAKAQPPKPVEGGEAKGDEPRETSNRRRRRRPRGGKPKPQGQPS